MKSGSARAQGGIGRRMPPAVFPMMMGLFGLGLAWRNGATRLGVPAEAADMLLGAVTLLFLFAAGMYGVKLIRRRNVVAEDLRVLPGRAGLSAGVLCLYLLSLTLMPYWPGLAGAVLALGFVLHLLLIGMLVTLFVNGPREQARVNPTWHLSFVGPIIGALAAAGLGQEGIARLIFGYAVIAALAIWGVSAVQFGRERVPAPLRPLLAIHLAPVALLGLVAVALGLGSVALVLAAVAAVLLAGLVLSVRWLTEAGFSALWGAFTFPLAATAGLWLAIGGVWEVPGMVALAAATVVVPLIAVRIVRMWMSGRLAAVTNAATA